MAEQKPLNFAPLHVWEQELAEIRPEISTPGYWRALEENCDQWAKMVSVNRFWNKASQNLSQWIAEYRGKTGEALLPERAFPTFIGKSGESILSKIHRCRSRDGSFDKVFSKDGPPIPKLNDLVRTRISCQYIDGVEFLANKLTQLAQNLNLNPDRNRQGRLEGYFAQHVYFTEEVFYKVGGGKSQPVSIRCEVQLATVLATRIWEGSHAIYEGVRETVEEPTEWQWNPRDPRFISRQLGHMIHLADGLLVQLREVVHEQKM